MVRAPHERTEGKAGPSRTPAAGRKQPPASGRGMNEELPWQPMASRSLDREQPPHLRISGAGRHPRALGYAAQAVRESNPRDRRPKPAWPWV